MEPHIQSKPLLREIAVELRMQSDPKTSSCFLLCLQCYRSTRVSVLGFEEQNWAWEEMSTVKSTKLSLAWNAFALTWCCMLTWHLLILEAFQIYPPISWIHKPRQVVFKHLLLITISGFCLVVLNLIPGCFRMSISVFKVYFESRTTT